ncbi:hypothetical protein [uncultured Roseobacter sp.]|uniref:hypothetical protein n=1 Tax=uncultured Roseobacter sp. TaxID=114847 RepID=UPI002615386A|nr:hypothetical protein [uncultured Roseobacter sp.]
MRQTAPQISFPVLQVTADLRSIAATGFGELSALMKPGVKPILRKVIFDQRCCLRPADARLIHGDLMNFAASPDRGIGPFMTATALLIADRLQGGAGTDDLSSNWKKLRDRYLEGPSPVRATLMNGFWRLQGVHRATPEQRVPARDLMTYDAEDLERLLRRIARSMTPEIRDNVCALAECETVEVHRRALDNCLDGSCVLSEFGDWFPGQVVEKASLTPDHPGYAGCTALVLLDAIETRDANEKMAFRWQEQAERYLRMRPEFRLPIVAGVRHLHEMFFDWQPYGGWSAEELMEKAVVVPFAKH